MTTPINPKKIDMISNLVKRSFNIKKAQIQIQKGIVLTRILWFEIYKYFKAIKKNTSPIEPV